MCNARDTIKISKKQHEIWGVLFSRQLDRIHSHAAREFLAGWELLDLPQDRIPSLAYLNAHITPRTGWKVVRTRERYSDAVPWYRAFAKKHFLVTDYMRTEEELDFTPEPDMFHDIFGHLPFMTLPEYTALQEMFAPAFERANAEQREDIKRLAWFSTEFGLILERGETKIFGAGLISSAGEMDHVLSGSVRLEPFTIENVLMRDKAIWSFNDTLFVFESLAALKAELACYFSTISDVV